MAWVVTDRGTAGADYGTSVTIASFTPNANTLLLISLLMRQDVDPSSIVGHGSWTKIGHISYATSRHVIFALLIGGSPSASTVVVNYPYSGSTIGIVDITGGNLTSIANAIVQNAVASQYNTGGGPHQLVVNLAAFASAANLSFLGCSTINNFTFSPESGWTEAQESASATGFQIAVQYRASEDTSCEVNGGTDYTFMSGIALELAEAALKHTGEQK